MCRHLAYLGPPVALHELLFGAPHSLRAQAGTPKHQTSGDSNPHGWGVGWYRDGAFEPERYRTVTPIWEDTAFAEDSRAIRSSAFVAAARLASPGATIEEEGNAPFVAGPWLFSLNGAVGGFHKGVGDTLRADVNADRRAAIVGDSDTEVLFAFALDRIDDGETPVEALVHVVERVTSVTKARLNMLLTDGHDMVATRFGNSLFVRGSTVASEPLDDDPDWREVPDGSIVVASVDDLDAATISSL